MYVKYILITEMSILKQVDLREIIFKRNSSYYERYGGSLFLATLGIIGIFYFFSDILTNSYKEDIVKDWENYRCTPFVIPFAGKFKKAPDQTAFEATGENFKFCLNSVLESVASSFTTPFENSTEILRLATETMYSSLEQIKARVSEIVDKLLSIFSKLYGLFAAFLTPIIIMINKVKDTIGKMQGVLATVIYSIYTGYLSIIKIFDVVLRGLRSTLAILAVMIAAALALGPFGIGPAIVYLAIFATYSVFVLTMHANLSPLTSSGKNYKLPKVGKLCFDEDNLIKLENGTSIPISQVEPGTRLWNGNEVTACFKVVRGNQQMFNINDVVVSGSHTVFDTQSQSWIPVCEHRLANYIQYYNRDTLYCLNTTHKTIEINNTVFSDWDDIEHDEYLQLVRNMIIKPMNNHHTFENYYVSGFIGSTKVRIGETSLWNKQISKLVPIKDIKPGDKLDNGGFVRAIVKVHPKHIRLTNRKSGYDILTCSQSSYIKGKYNGDTFKPVYEYKKSPIKNEYNSTETLYHIVSSTGDFGLGISSIAADYDYTIERHLK